MPSGFALSPSFSRVALSILALLAAGLILTGSPTRVAALTSFTVDSAADEVDLNPGDGTCATLAGTCTLRAAVQEASAAGDTTIINLPDGDYQLDLVGAGEDGGAHGDLDVTGDVEVAGAGAADTFITGVDDRVVHVLSSGNVKLTNLSIRNGTADSGAGVLNEGVLELENVEVTNNTFTLSGGGIHNAGTVTVHLSKISGNSGGSLGAGIYAGPGSHATITHSGLVHNSATFYGGAICSEGWPLEQRDPPYDGGTGLRK